MSLAIPTRDEYREALDRLAAEYARRRMAEREVARLKDSLRRRNESKPRDWTWEMYDAAELMPTLPPESTLVTSERRALLSGAVA